MNDGRGIVDQLLQAVICFLEGLLDFFAIDELGDVSADVLQRVLHGRLGVLHAGEKELHDALAFAVHDDRDRDRRAQFRASGEVASRERVIQEQIGDPGRFSREPDGPGQFGAGGQPRLSCQFVEAVQGGLIWAPGLEYLQFAA